MTDSALHEKQLRSLLEVGRALVSELDPEALLNRVLETAKELTGARYAALGILDKNKSSLERFLHLGIDQASLRGIGPLPQGRGVLGELISHPEPLRLARVGDHPRSYGFPPGHPPMSSFVGVPIRIRGESFGNIYLTEKADGQQFNDLDEAMIVILADWAAVAIGNARLYEDSENRRVELERAVQALEATVSLARVGAMDSDLDSLYELIVKRGRALVDANTVLLLTAEPKGQLRISAVAGVGNNAVEGHLFPESHLLERVRGEVTAQRMYGAELELSCDLGFEHEEVLILHLDYRGRRQGFLVAIDPLGRNQFTPENELVFSSFGTSAANSLGTAGDIEQERLRMAIEASEQERRRWAMELHDETLQDLGALKVLQEGAIVKGDPDTMRQSLASATTQLDRTIATLELLIHELRPASLDALGLEAAVETLLDRVCDRASMSPELHFDLAFDRGDSPTRLAGQIEATAYRVIQESLNNAAKHSGASRVSVSVTESATDLTIFVEDNGKGFVPEDGFGDRFGLHGMRERVELADGEMEIDSSPGNGTRVEVHIPV